jgi:hypothetical protein
VKHFASPQFWRLYRQLPADVRDLADKNFRLLKADPKHPSLHFKRIDKLKLMKLVITAFVLLILAAPLAYSCECSSPGHRKAFKNAAAVFIGEVVDINDSNVPVMEGTHYSYAVKFKIIEYWKGDANPTVIVHTEQGAFSCDLYKFRKGEKYLVYASGKNLIAFTGCSRSAPLSDAVYISEELKRLGKSKKPTNIEATLSQNSVHRNSTIPNLPRPLAKRTFKG